MSLWYGLSGSIQNSSMPRGQWKAPGIMPSRSSSRMSRRSTKTTPERPCRSRASSRLIVVIRDFASSTSCRNPFRSAMSAFSSSASVVGDAVDPARLVVGDEQGAVRHDEDVGRATAGEAAFQPAGGKRLVGRRAGAVHVHIGYAVADRRAAIPGAVLGDEDAAAVLLGEHRAGVEAHPDRRDVRIEPPRRRRELGARAVAVVLGVGHAVAVTVGEAEVLAGAGEPVQLLGGLGVAGPIATGFGGT